MVTDKSSHRLDAANTFRHGLFNCFFDEEPSVRADTLKTLGQVVEYWTLSWQEYLKASSVFSSSPRFTRPPLARNSSNGSGVSPTPPASGGILRRDSSFRMQFEDVFGIDGDESTGLVVPRRKDSAVLTPLTPEKDDPWMPLSGGDCAVSPSEASATFPEGEVSFSNKGLGQIEHANRDIVWAGRFVADEVWGVEDMRTNLENFQTWLLRFSIDCPYKDVRKGCREILKRSEKYGAQLPEVPVRGPSFFIPIIETIGLNYGPWTPSTPKDRKTSDTFDPPSEDEEDTITFSPKESNVSVASGIMIPSSDRTRSTSRGRTPVGSFSRASLSRRATVSLVSSLFQTPPSPPNGLNSSFKFKRRGNVRRPIPKFLPKPREPSEEVRNLQLGAFMRTGRVGNFNKILFYFPKFAEVNREITDLFMSDESINGPLPQKWRIYLGIIAAAEKKCQYFLSLLSEKFLTVQGDKEWLKGLEYVPLKLQRIARLNGLLAHRPWTIGPGHVKELVRGEDGKDLDPEQKWSMAEVVQAICILSFYHAKSAMALAWAIQPESDLLGGTVKTIEKRTPVAPFGSFAPTTTSGELTSELEARLKREDAKQPALSSNRKRQQTEGEGEYAVELPEKWRKTPSGSVPFISSPTDSDNPITTPVDVPQSKNSGDELQASMGHYARNKSQKRRKSFEECATSDDAPPPFMGLNGSGFSLSAPNSYIPFSSLSSARPLAYTGRDLLSPSSSTSSLFDTTNLLGEQVAANVLVEDNTRFLHPESLDHKHEDFDPNSWEYEFLPMEEFEWERNASSIISDYLDGVMEQLDHYFKEALDADAEDEDLFSAAVENLPPRHHLADELSPSGTSDRFEDIQDIQKEAEPEDEESGLDRQDRTERSFNSYGRSASSPPRYTYETKGFKEAAWFYSLRLVGIQKDDFRYSEIKVLLDKGSRRYLKRVCAQPDMVSVADWMGAGQGMGGLKNEEKCLLSLLACQARFLGEMLWGIRGVSEYIG